MRYIQNYNELPVFRSICSSEVVGFPLLKFKNIRKNISRREQPKKYERSRLNSKNREAVIYLVKCNLTKLTTTSLAVKRFTSVAVKQFTSIAVKRFTSLAVERPTSLAVHKLSGQAVYKLSGQAARERSGHPVVNPISAGSHGLW